MREGGYVSGQETGLRLSNVGLALFQTQQRYGVLPTLEKNKSKYKKDHQIEARYQSCLEFMTLWELGGTHRRTHQNLEDVGLLEVQYWGLDICAADDELWDRVPLMADLDINVRYDLLYGLMDLMRKRHALFHNAILEPPKFEQEVISQLNEATHIHDQNFRGPIGYSDIAKPSYPNTIYRLTGTNTQPVIWVRRVFEELGEPLQHADALDLVTRIVEKLGDSEAGFLVKHTISP